MDRCIELTEGLWFRPPILVFGFDRKVDIVIQAIEMVPAIFTGNVRPDRPGARVLQFHGDTGKRVASHVGYHAGYVAQLELRDARRQDQQPDQRSENELP